jgi:tRNA U34 5-carboxymethylaminomethyl modifying GTPase MnmE/TrmE
MAADYVSIKNGLQIVIDELSGQELNGSRRLQELREKLIHQQFNLVVMGQFKRGKSTFINALLGSEIVPTAIVPLTSIVTLLCFGPQPKAVVHFLDGRREETALDEIRRFVTEKENPRNQLNVKEVEVFYPCAHLKDGVRIIDTPGVGSVFSHNTELAYAYLPNVDAGIFVVTADPPLSASEHRFLREVRGYVNNLFFVLNKIDIVGEKDLEEALSFTTEILQEDLKHSVKVWPISARLALEGRLNADSDKLNRSGLPPFEDHLRQFLHKEKGKAFLQAMTASLMRYVSDESMAWKLEQEAAKLGIEELRSKIAKFEEFVRQTEKERDEHRFILTGQIRKMHEGLDRDLEALKRERVIPLLTVIENHFRSKSQSSSDGRGIESELEELLYQEILDTFSVFRDQAARKLSDSLETIYMDLAERTNRTILGIVNLAASLFKVELKPFTSVEKLTGKSDFYFLLKDDPDAIALIRLGFRSAMPSFITRGLILKRIKSMAQEIFERHCGRVRYDLIQRIDETTRKFQKSLSEKTELTLSTIREALKRAIALKNRNETEVSATLSQLTTRLSTAEQIRERLAAYRNQAENI